VFLGIELELMAASGIRSSLALADSISGLACLSLLQGNTESKKPGCDGSTVLIFSPSVCADAVDVERGVGTVRCAVRGLEGTDGSVSCDDTVDSANKDDWVRFAVEGRLGAGRNAGSVGDSGCASCRVVTSEY
jgi:hypothetical protein